MNILKHKAVIIAIVLLVLAVVGRWWQGEQSRRQGESVTPVTISDAVQDYIIVQVDGAAVKPGVYQITVDAHVMDLIFLAGGLLPEARLGKINLAKVLENGDRIHVLGALKRKKPQHGQRKKT